jgi:uncharacterized protein
MWRKLIICGKISQKMSNVKITIVSDSHDNKDHVEKIADVANEAGCMYLFHLGDIVSPYTAEKLSSFKGIVKAVYGNCDGDLLGLQRVFNTMGGDIEKSPFKLELEGKRIIMMHEPVLLDELIKSQEADYIFYGHLHKVDFRRVGKTTVLNPGDAGGWVRKATFFILDLFSGEAEQIDIK